MSKKQLAKRILLALNIGIFCSMPLVSALPNQGNFDNSSVASIVTNGSTMNIMGKSANNILNWLTFSVAKGETVKFNDKNNYLNLVNGVDISRIYGTISGGNTVYLVNPYGILFGQGATLDNVGSFIASTRDISDINQQAFLNDPTNLTGVLYTDEEASRNKDYHPTNSPYVPIISVADINLTNVPASATQIVLDGPDGVVLKNTQILDKVKYVITRTPGGEIGIGTDNFNSPISLTEEQQRKIYLIENKEWKNFADAPNLSILTPYQWIRNINELQAIDDYIKNNPGVHRNYMLTNDIDASGYNFKSIGGNVVAPSDENTFRGTFEGLGYEISNLKGSEQDIDVSQNGLKWHTVGVDQGLFSSAVGTIRNLSLINENITPAHNNYVAGGVASFFAGSMSNVSVSGQIRGYGATVGGLVGKLYNENSQDPPSEIRNSNNAAFVQQHSGTDCGGLVGNLENASLYNVYNAGNVLGGTTSMWVKGNGWGATYELRGYGGNNGGIVGNVSGNINLGQRILSAYNTGDVDLRFSYYGTSHGTNIIGEGAANGGIVGRHGGAAKIGEAYNFGKVRSTSYAGGIIGYKDDTAQLEYVTNSNKTLPSYYVSSNVLNDSNLTIQGTQFGIPLLESELKDVFNKNWYGAGTRIMDDSTSGDTSGTNVSDNTGGNSGSTSGETNVSSTSSRNNTSDINTGSNTVNSNGSSTTNGGIRETSVRTETTAADDALKKINAIDGQINAEEANNELTNIYTSIKQDEEKFYKTKYTNPTATNDKTKNVINTQEIDIKKSTPSNTSVTNRNSKLQEFKKTKSGYTFSKVIDGKTYNISVSYEATVRKPKSASEYAGIYNKYNKGEFNPKKIIEENARKGIEGVNKVMKVAGFKNFNMSLENLQGDLISWYVKDINNPEKNKELLKECIVDFGTGLLKDAFDFSSFIQNTSGYQSSVGGAMEIIITTADGFDVTLIGLKDIERFDMLTSGAEALFGKKN